MALDPSFEVAFAPRSIAVLGASSKERGGGNGFIKSIKEMRYKGNMYPINPNVEEVLGYKCYPSLAAVPEVPDLVIMAVGAHRAEQALEECIARGVRNVHMFTAGFGETGEEEGEKLAERLRAIAERGKLNIVGPNCMGIYSPRGRISPWGRLPLEVGPIALISQSGALGGEFVRRAPTLGLRMSYAISYGNGYVLDSTDFLEYLENDPHTRFIGMYLEGVRDGRKLLELVRRISPKKPVVILKGGLTDAGARAAASHTGSLAGQDAIWSAFFAQSGAIRVDSLEEMVDVLQALVRLPAPTGSGVCLIGGAGGTSVAAADICARAGLEVPTISEDIQKELREFIGVAGTSVRNPMDISMQMSSPQDFIRALEILDRDPVIDITLMVLYVFPKRFGWGKGVLDLVPPLIKFANSSRKPFCVATKSFTDHVQTERDRLTLTRMFTKAGVPVFKTVERAAMALHRYAEYYRSLSDRLA